MFTILNKISVFLMIALLTVLLYSCNEPPVIDKSMDVNETAWDVKENLKVEVQIEDTISSFGFYVNVRNTTDYKYSNFFLFIKTNFPDGEIAIDTLECILADNQGKWYGKGNGKIKDNKILFKKAAIFPMKGKYLFEIEHAMREKQISGIKSIGFRIEKNKNN